MARVRNPEAVLAALSYTPKKPVIAKKTISVRFPVRFEEAELATISAQNSVYGLVMLLLESGEYGLLNVNASLNLGPAIVTIVKEDDVDYYNFLYQEGQVVFESQDLVCQSGLIYSALKEFILMGKVPKYVDYDDMGKLFSTAVKHARTTAVILPSVVEFLASYIARSEKDRTKFYRETLGTGKPVGKPSWVPLLSVYYSAPGTVNKLAGAYFNPGVVSALVNPSERVETVESILRA